MTRHAILPTHADPILVNMWLAATKEALEYEIDSVTCTVTGPQDLVEETYRILVLGLAGKLTRCLLEPGPGEGSARHGAMLKLAIEEAPPGAHVVLLESDCFPLHPKVLDSGFQIIEQGGADVVGSGRDTASPWLAETAIKELLPQPPTDEHYGVGLWPCMLFASRETLMEAGPNYGPGYWKAGDWIPGIPVPAPTDVAADTFYEASLKLRAIGKKIYAVPQNKYHAAIEGGLGRDTRNWSYVPTIHIGSLSALARPDGSFAISKVESGTNEHELAKRLATLLLAVRVWADQGRQNQPDSYDAGYYVSSLRSSTNLPERLIRLHMIRIGSALSRAIPSLQPHLLSDMASLHRPGLWNDIMKEL